MAEQTPSTPSQNPGEGKSLPSAISFALQKFLQGEVDGCLPARVIAYNRKKNLATVQPLISLLATSGQSLERAQIAEVPVLALGGGGFAINFPLKKDDLGWIIANDRDISLYIQNGTAQPVQPNTQRLHKFSDAMFVPDVLRKYSINAEDNAAMVIQSLSGGTRIAIADNEVRITASSKVKITAPNTEIDSVLKVTKAATFDSTVLMSGKATMPAGATIANRDFVAHTHPDAHGGNTGPVNQ